MTTTACRTATVEAKANDRFTLVTVSPRTWGWTVEHDRLPNAPSVFPTCVVDRLVASASGIRKEGQQPPLKHIIK